MNIESSGDVLNIAIAFSIALVAVFLAWLLYYLIAILRDARAMVADVRHKMESVENAIQSIRAKIESGVSAFGVIALALKQVIAYAIEKRGMADEEEEVEEKPKRKK